MKEKFSEVFSKLLVQNMEKFRDARKLDRATCLAIYTTIFDTVTHVLKESEVQISNEAANFIAQTYYDGVRINGKHELDPSIFDKRATIDQINNKDLVTILALLDGMEAGMEIFQALKRR